MTQSTPAMSPDAPSRAKFLLSFVLLADYRDCRSIECPIAVWLSHATSLSGIVQVAERRRTVIDVFSRCRTAGSVRASNGVVVRSHSTVPVELARTQAFASQAYMEQTRRGSNMAVTLTKWVVVGIEDAEFVVCVDLDVDLLPKSFAARALDVAATWHTLFDGMRRGDVDLATFADHSAPINSGFMVVRPDAELYRAGLELLGRANTSFDIARGWELLGPPRDVVPRTDVVWHGKDFMKRNDWAFVGADIDQGFFFHMYRVRRTRGAVDLDLQPLASPAAREGDGGPDGQGGRRLDYCFLHFASKPWIQLPKLPKCRIRLKLRWLAKVHSFLRDAEEAFGGQLARSIVDAPTLGRCAGKFAMAMACMDPAAALIVDNRTWAMAKARPAAKVWPCRRLLPHA
mmetsp:Transcript_24754/g.72771  ORF Transcript_24754/g.72771 Transcript_24754/m.72771 type:complete len:401 (-) Transcript_24754:117-1319(-)|eukprot:CAMPEP_0206052910 /NCGR_PEP_ID=MMETSP1466-20131121/34716_1 /ASSEMBLY_ACC=CAM_ASM_001126 /TAXON_ID=44452 /ORGANISM="Pavlova gyrans, Strain CCMP608" /LENGTH=400 /DNA_ID=CAMNT_0053428071 /DNA_START=90 /DNA_END=1292 /DNA_ORIENTATION=+